MGNIIELEYLIGWTDPKFALSFVLFLIENSLFGLQIGKFQSPVRNKIVLEMKCRRKISYEGWLIES